jgi:two-component system, chemotaxis family, CheB/CheR fusion protein
MADEKRTKSELLAKIAALQKTIEQLEDNERQLMVLIDNAPESLFILSDWKFRYVNNALVNLYGATDALQLLGTQILDRIPESHKDLVQSRIIGLNEHKLSYSLFESRHMKLDGTMFDVEISAVPIVYHGKDGALVFIRDVTERNKVENEIRAKNRFIQTVLDHLPIGISLNRISDGVATYLNEKFTEIYGWPEEEMEGVSAFFEKVYPDEQYRKEIMDRILSDIQSGNPKIMHWEGITVTAKDGTRRIVNAVNIPLEDQDTMVSTVMDMTQQKHAETALRNALEKAQESDRLKTAFLQNMSHEIRTPMNSICGFSEMLKGEDLSLDKKTSFLDIIINSTNQLLSIVNDILSISSIETGQAKLNVRGTSINRILHELADMFRPKAGSQHLVLTAVPGLPDDQSVVFTDDTKLKQILTNLINNALKFTLSGTVEFGYELKGNDLEFFVRDTGVGIAPEMHEKIFERFFQVETGISRRFGGTGLGLSISKSYVEMLGGRIWLESVPDQGSTFRFSIPFRQGEDIPAKETLRRDPTNLPLILVAEDEEYNFLYLSELLSRNHFRVMHAWNGEEAVSYCKNHTGISVVIMDLKMPVMDGYEATRKIKSLRPHLPVIAHTAYALQSELEEMGETGFNGYLGKPVTPEQLFDLLSKYFS